LCRRSVVPSETTPAFAGPRASKADARRMQRAKKRSAEIEKMKSDLKKPTATQINSKKDRKVMKNQVQVSNKAVALRERNDVSHL
jgi:hypothetical protein